MPRSFRYTRPSRGASEGVVDFLSRRFTYLAREAWVAQVAAGHVSVDGRVLQRDDADVPLQQGQCVVFAPPRTLEPAVDEEHVEVVYEDDWLVVCAKNGNLPVSEGGRYCENTLTALLTRRGTAAFAATSSPRTGTAPVHEDGVQRELYPVHRLDKETSGLVLLAKNVAVAGQLSRLMACGTYTAVNLPSDVWLPPEAGDAMERTLCVTQTNMRKRYVALLVGCCARVGYSMLITAPIGPLCEHPTLHLSPEHQRLRRLKMVCYSTAQDAAAAARGKPACTRLRVLATDPALNVSLVGVDLFTGRTHQIRVHCAHVGHPVLGDKLYTTTTPGRVGSGAAVHDDVYLAAVRAEGAAAFVRHALVPQLRCRRHLLHAAALDFTHPHTGAPLHLTSAPLPYFAADVECASDEARVALHRLLSLSDCVHNDSC